MNGTQYLDTINVYTSPQTEQDGIRENISYALNVLLLLITIYSEMSGVSSCNHNGIVDGFIKVCKENKKKVCYNMKSSFDKNFNKFNNLKKFI